MKFKNLKRLAATAAFGLVALLGASEVANAQTWKDYKDYEKQQRKIAKQQQKAQRQQQKIYNRNYRVYNNGGYYQTDQRGVELLRQAVNRGYQQGYYAGQRDRQYGRGYDYNSESMYRGGNYGYQGYVDTSQYRYYFQQGFSRGYEDGYRSTSRYGYNSSGGWNILSSILQGILNFR